MFVDEIEIYAKAGNGGDGVVRWHRTKFKPKGGPAGGNGGRGGDVYVRAVRNLNILSKYTGAKNFIAKNGESGKNSSQHGKGSLDVYIDVPVGSHIKNLEKDRTYSLNSEDDVIKILKGGRGGLGNERFKSSTNQSPEESTKGEIGEEGNFKIELSLVVDVGLIGFPNAGKSTLLNLLTNAKSDIGDFSFTTTEPHLGSFHGYAIVDIPGLIEGAADGKGLGHKFLRHIAKTKMVLHLISLNENNVENAYKTVKNELSKFNKSMFEKEEWIILTKKDLVNKEDIEASLKSVDKYEKRVFVIAENDVESIKLLHDELIKNLRSE